MSSSADARSLCRDIQQVASSEAVLEGFFSSCLGNGDLCALTQLDTTQKNIRQQFDELFDSVSEAPKVIDNTTSPPTILNIQTLATSVSGALYTPTIWPILAEWLYGIFDNNVTAYNLGVAVLGLPEPIREPFPELAQIETIPAIRCSDVLLRSTSVSPEPAAIAEALIAQSPNVGSSIATSQSLLCPQWPFEAKEQYSGDFDVETKNPILFVGNFFDPVTSLGAARNASATFSGSGLLVHSGYGHTSLAQTSTCSMAAIAAYYLNGTLPPEGTICQPDVPLFDRSLAALLGQ
jgi:hypothetical protein